MTSQSPWPYASAERRWYGMGRYYAMFPPQFAYDAIKRFTGDGDSILDPFCGRGNAPYIASVMGRNSFAIDINPIAWLYSEVKLNPEPELEKILARLKTMERASRNKDRRSRSRFETMAWTPRVRSFLKAARRELDWQRSVLDRTLMAFIVLHMQDKRGHGLSNALWPTIACSPHYAVRWWTKHGLTRPPDVDPVAVLEAKIRRRYAYGIPPRSNSTAKLGDAASVLKHSSALKARLLITSPPYKGVTDYWNDHWIRLWALGESLRKNWKRSAKFENIDMYRNLLKQVFIESKRHLADDSIILIRSDRRHQTAKICQSVLCDTWPNRNILKRESTAPFNGVSVHHGNGGSKSQEIDFLLLPNKLPELFEVEGFVD